MKNNKITLFMHPVGIGMGLLKPKDYLRKKTTLKTVAMYFHSSKKIYFWHSIDPTQFVVPDPIKDYLIQNTAHDNQGD